MGAAKICNIIYKLSCKVADPARRLGAGLQNGPVRRLSSAMGQRMEGNELIYQIGRQIRRNRGGIEIGNDLEHVTAFHVYPLQAAHQIQNFAAGESAHLRRAGARRIGRVDCVDVNGDEAAGAPTRL